MESSVMPPRISPRITALTAAAIVITGCSAKGVQPPVQGITEKSPTSSVPDIESSEAVTEIKPTPAASAGAGGVSRSVVDKLKREVEELKAKYQRTEAPPKPASPKPFQAKEAPQKPTPSPSASDKPTVLDRDGDGKVLDGVTDTVLPGIEIPGQYFPFPGDEEGLPQPEEPSDMDNPGADTSGPAPDVPEVIPTDAPASDGVALPEPLAVP
ncbi:hypothetical protein [Streptomyces sp. NPDC058861]|uniref:hypothetical protein n=1 Tax=Streptomyces sp. NPDC058861 TaxID=3346653 RepID=UPI0036B4865E